LNPGPLHWKCGVLASGPPGKPQNNNLDVVLRMESYSGETHQWAAGDGSHAPGRHTGRQGTFWLPLLKSAAPEAIIRTKLQTQ